MELISVTRASAITKLDTVTIGMMIECGELVNHGKEGDIRLDKAEVESLVPETMVLEFYHQLPDEIKEAENKALTDPH